jgi:hypothetical protein
MDDTVRKRPREAEMVLAAVVLQQMSVVWVNKSLTTIR